MLNRFLLKGALAAAFVTACVSTPAMAASFTYNFDIDHCTGGCGTMPAGTITISDFAANQVQLSLVLFNSNQFVLTGAANGGSTLAFNLAGNQTISLVSSTLTGWALDSAGVAGSHQFDGFGNFEYSLNCCNGSNGGSNAQSGPEVLVLSGTGLTAAAFNELSTSGSPNVLFALDVLSGSGPTQGNTGPVGATYNPVPEPSTFAISAMFLAIGAIARKRFKHS